MFGMKKNKENQYEKVEEEVVHGDEAVSEKPEVVGGSEEFVEDPEEREVAPQETKTTVKETAIKTGTQKKKVTKKETEEPKEKIIVLKELQMQPVRRAALEDGTIVNFITIEEALTELYNQE